MDAHFKILVVIFLLFLNSLVVQSLSDDSEWRALLELRSSLGISAKNWHKKLNPCLNWTGIACENGRVTGINLSGLRRTRSGKLYPRFAVDSLPNFKMLSSFNSSGFLLPGPIPEWLGQRLPNLEVLDLRSSSIYGSIPPSIGSLSKLNSLYLSDNSITGIFPSALGKLFSLSVLDLSQNLLTGSIPSEISALANLSNLDLSSNFLSGSIPIDFGSFSSLKMLNLSNNSLSSFIPNQLGNLSQLIELDLEYNSLMGSLPNELGRLRNLRKMLIGNNALQGSLSDCLFQNLTKLEYLSLGSNYFDGKFPDSLGGMPQLKRLDISGNNFTGFFPIFNASFNVNGAVFNISKNRFYGNLTFGIEKLGILDVSNNYFEGLAPNATMSSIILLSNNCFSNVVDQRNTETCADFYAEQGLVFKDNAEPVGRPKKDQHKRKRGLIYIMVGVFGGLGFVIFLIFGLLLGLRIRNARSKNLVTKSRSVEHVIGKGNEPPPDTAIDLSNLGESFTYEQMVQATCNFSNENLIKRGHSGHLFSGKLEDEQHVVIKKVDLRSFRKESFMSELDLFGKVTHRRLVPLMGHCLEDEHEKILVYKYMPNEDLSNSFFKLIRTEEEVEEVRSLDWITRWKIAIGAAEALSYLHHECIPPIIHRDIRTTSILLDDKYEVRLGSLSEVSAQGVASPPNLISRLLQTPQTSDKRPSGSSFITCAYDVYCFGKVLLELVTGRLGLSSLNDSEAKQWLESNLPYISQHDKELILKIVDQSLIIDEDLLEEVWAVAIVAKSCLNPKPSRRPSMRHVLKALENPFKVVREESFSSGNLRQTPSRQNWTAAFFSSWRRSSSGNSNVSNQTNREIIGGLRQSGRVGSRGSGANTHSSSHKRSSSDVFPEPLEMQDVERQNDTG
ncbi:probable LRR receptor-like serine/threonine-protein kinase At2g16250 [Henckelia pumila]|uniref:probable LRR receptor-like serine/threonine-protein kinase At2g16250 n=1 Tax=Henckelia pumila TaxID=405737 RepID=UPI003C6E493A